jgi:hypothetical protein
MMVGMFVFVCVVWVLIERGLDRSIDAQMCAYVRRRRRTAFDDDEDAKTRAYAFS